MMKKILLMTIAVIALSCEQGNKRQSESGEPPDTVNSEENVEENSGENISPQLEDSADRLEVDTVSSSSADKEKENDLNEK